MQVRTVRGRFRKHLAQALKALREEHKLTQAELAIKIGVAPRSYERWEDALTEPRVTELVVLETIVPGLVKRVLAFRA